jgi:uncharacterized repeat protein (TIGR01451 family)
MTRRPRRRRRADAAGAQGRARLPRRLRLAALAVLALAALAGFTGVARSAMQEGGVTRRQQLAQESSERRAALQAERAAARQEQREARRQREAQRAQEKQGNKERETGGGHIFVDSECTNVKLVFTQFPQGSRNLRELITIFRNHGKEGIKLPLHFAFTGSEATQEVNLPVFRGKYTVDVLAFWKGGHFDVPGQVECGPTPQMALEKLERIGPSGEYVRGPLTGNVGETVDYAIVVRNTGNVPLTLTNFEDPVCDPGTIVGGESPLAAGASTKFMCTHLLTEADLHGSPLLNTAELIGTPPEGEGNPQKVKSNTVEVTVTTPPPTPPGGPSTPPGTSTTVTGNAVAGTQFAGSGIGASIGPSTGVLSFVQTTPPSLRGAQGCVRNTFKASLKAKGVSSVAFYLDGHRLRTMSARSARRGLLTITIDTSRLRVGGHRLVAKIMMARVASSSRQVRASRSLTFVRCASAAVRPKFTG